MANNGGLLGLLAFGSFYYQARREQGLLDRAIADRQAVLDSLAAPGAGESQQDALMREQANALKLAHSQDPDLSRTGQELFIRNESAAYEIAKQRDGQKIADEEATRRHAIYADIQANTPIASAQNQVQNRMDLAQVAAIQSQRNEGFALLDSPNPQDQEAGRQKIQAAEQAYNQYTAQNETDARADQDKRYMAYVAGQKDAHAQSDAAAEVISNKIVEPYSEQLENWNRLQALAKDAKASPVSLKAAFVTLMIGITGGKQARTGEQEDFRSQSPEAQQVVEELSRITGDTTPPEIIQQVLNTGAAAFNGSQTTYRTKVKSYLDRFKAQGVDTKAAIATLPEGLYAPAELHDIHALPEGDIPASQAPKGLQVVAEPTFDQKVSAYLLKRDPKILREATYGLGKTEAPGGENIAQTLIGLLPSRAGAIRGGTPGDLQNVQRYIEGKKLVRDSKGKLYNQDAEGNLHPLNEHQALIAETYLKNAPSNVPFADFFKGLLQ